MSPTRKLSLAYRSPIAASFSPNAMTQPPLPERDTMSDTPVPVDPDISGMDMAPNGPPLSPEKQTRSTSEFKTPTRKESLRDRRARQRQVQSQRSSYDALNSLHPASPTSNGLPMIPPVTTIVPPPADLSIPYLPMGGPPTIAEPSGSEPNSGEVSTRSVPLSGRSVPSAMDARKLTRIAQAMGLVSTGPTSIPQVRQPRSKRASIGDRSLPRRRPSANGTWASPARSGFSVASTSRTGTGRTHGAGRAADLGGRGHLVQVIPPDHLFVPTGFSPLVDLEDVEESFDSLNASSSREKELRRWRKGRLLPLRGTMDGMVKDVVTEWGLPSGIGMTLYLVNEDERAISSLDDEEPEQDHDGGMKCSPEAWKILWADLFNPINIRLPSSRFASPRGPIMPDRNGRLSVERPEATEDLADDPSGNLFQAGTNQKGLFEGFLTPASARSFQLFNSDPGNSPGKRSSLAPSASASQTNSPPRKRRQDSARDDNQTSPTFDFASRTLFQPSQRPSRIVGRIEFDFDRDRAKWYDAWRKRKHEANNSPMRGGLRQLKLGTSGGITDGKGSHPNDLATPDADPGGTILAAVSPSSLKSTDEESDSDYGMEPSPQVYAQLDDEHVDETPDETLDRTLDVSPHEDASESSDRNISDDDEEEFAILRADRLGQDKTEFGFEDIGSNAILDDNVLEARLAGPVDDVFEPLTDIQEVERLLVQRDRTSLVETPLLNVPEDQGKGLASPINLPSPNTTAEHREAGTPSLSITPAEDRKLSIEIPESSRPAMFGLGMGLEMAYDKRGSSLVMSDQLDLLERAMKDLSPREIRLSVFGPSAAQQARNRSQTALVHDEDISPKTMDVATLADESSLDVTVAKTPGTSPVIPDNVLSAQHQKYTPRSVPDGTTPITISPETMARMEYEHVPKQRNLSAEGGWRPQRPARPPSPHLDQFAAPSPPVVLRDVSRQEVELAIPPAQTEGMSPDLGNGGRPRTNSGKGKTLFNHNPLNKLFQRKGSDKSDHEDAGITLTHISGPIMIAEEAESPRHPAMPTFSPTPDQDEFGVLHGSNGPGQTAQSTSTKSPKTPGFGRRLFKGSFGSHGRSVSSPKITPAIGNGQPSSSRAVPLPPNVRSPSNPLPPRGRTTSAPTIESAEAVSMRGQGHTTRSPSTSDAIVPTSPGLSVKRKPVPRKEEDAFLPTSQSTISLASVLLDDVPRSAKTRKISGQASPDLTVRSKVDATTISAPIRSILVEDRSKETDKFFS